MLRPLYRLALATVLVSAFSTVDLAAKTGTQSEWTTDFGPLSLTVEEGQRVEGVYSAFQGRVVGSISRSGPEAVVEGVWVQPTSEQRCAAAREGSSFWGLVRWTVRADGSLRGQWSYCDRPLGSGGAWNGQQISGTNPVETAPAPPGKLPLEQRPSPSDRASSRDRRASATTPFGPADVGEGEVERHLRLQFGQTVARGNLHTLYADLTCDGSLEGIVGYLNSDHPDGPFFQVMIVTYERGDLESVVHTFAYQAEPPTGFCGPPSLPEMSVMALGPDAALDLTGYGAPLCPTALRLADPLCDALWLFYWPSDAPEPEFMLGHN